ncbi:unnamed protein product [Colias eurytheme]|nr:unnamed protein product [Colias eurytheme]
MRVRIATHAHTRALSLANCSLVVAAAFRLRCCATLDNFSRKLTCITLVNKPSPRPRGQRGRPTGWGLHLHLRIPQASQSATHNTINHRIGERMLKLHNELQIFVC